MTRTVLVTGGARGIGRAIVEDMARDHNVALTWHVTKPDTDPAIQTIRADLCEDGTANHVVQEVFDRYGRLDVIVNNAGRVTASPKESFDAQAQRALFDLNVLAPAALLSAALPQLDRGACIVNISSMNAVLPPMGAATYGASKAALNLWTRGMAKELGPRGIRVNGVAPGAIHIDDAPRSDETVQQLVEMTALARIGRPEDVARAVRFLASDAASFITGEVITVSGGYRL